MALKTVVKVGSISNLSDARYCAGMGVQYLGFSFEQDNKNFIEQDTFETFKEWVVGPVMVGEISGTELTDIEKLIASYKTDCLEIEHPEILAETSLLSLPIILKLDISAFQKTEELQEVLAYACNKVIFFILEKTSDSVLLPDDILNLADHYKIMVGFSIDKESVHAWLDGTNIFGISMKGGSEIKPGLKDYDELADILEELEEE
jgi:phosphoribosylanthranilate isomerase